MENKNQTAFNLLIENYLSGGASGVNYVSVVSRLQDQFFTFNEKVDNTRSAYWWNQKEFFEPNEVDTKIPTIEQGQYSSFAVKEYGDGGYLHFPLKDDHLSIVSPFFENDMSLGAYQFKMLQIKDRLKTKVVDTSKEGAGFKQKARPILKIKNFFLRLAKKETVANFAGTITLQSKYGKGKLSNAEKLIKVYDYLLKVSVKQVAGKEKYSNGVLNASRVLADMLMCRATDFGGKENFAVVDKCLSLQFANILNKYGFDGKQLEEITHLATSATAKLCKRLDITDEEILTNIKNNGYISVKVPQNTQEILLFAEKEITKEQPKVQTQNQANAEPQAQAQTQNEKNWNDLFDSQKQDIDKWAEMFIAKEKARQTAENENVIEGTYDLVDDEIREEKTASKTPDVIILPDKMPTDEESTNEAPEQVNIDDYINGLVVRSNKSNFPVVDENKQFDSWVQVLADIANSGEDEVKRKALSKKAVYKYIDEVVRKHIAYNSVSYAERANNVCKAGSKAFAENKKRAGIYALTLAYYEANIRSTCYAGFNDEYTDEEIELTKTIAEELYKRREMLGETILTMQDQRDQGQRLSSFVQEICEKINAQKIKHYFLAPVKATVEHYISYGLNPAPEKANLSSAEKEELTR